MVSKDESAHGGGPCGGLPGEQDDSAAGSCTTMLISTDRDCEMINATPRRSGIPVNITAVIG